ncbi:hypothetical protein LEN26_009313 [Aphanomyces euteiches]|nr:hypothetical protein AeMF1_009385 [Aphanomyces euteiches]KAH9127061.1 hypothetical protein LEN26_009313 [Aphanomyces euteiches]KAH9190747.1 hypothetical protein AeNC1_007268 [Aphanomyces euteiches]
MDGRQAQLLQELATLQLNVFEEQVKIFHEQVEGCIAITGTHPLTQENASSVCTVQGTNWKKYSRALPSPLLSETLATIVFGVCNSEGYIESSELLQWAFEKVKQADLNTSDRIHFLFLLLHTLEKRKLNKRTMKEDDFRAMRVHYEDNLDMLMGWVQASVPYLNSDSRDQDLVHIVLQLVTKFPPSKQSEKQKLATTLRDLRSQAKNPRAPNGSSERREPDELNEILAHVSLKKKDLKNAPVFKATLRANGGTFCQKKSELECAQYILKRCHNDGFDWRLSLVLKSDEDENT